MGAETSTTAGEENEDRTVCFCHNVKYSDLRRAVNEGADTLEKIQDQTCASTGCGGCETEVIEILAQLKRELNNKLNHESNHEPIKKAVANG